MWQFQRKVKGRPVRWRGRGGKTTTNTPTNRLTILTFCSSLQLQRHDLGKHVTRFQRFAQAALTKENLMRILLIALNVILCLTSVRAEEEKSLYTKEERADYCKRFQIYEKDFHFPKQSFLETGYSPPGGYVKDFSVLKHDGRYHLFHIDGRGAEQCIDSGNEISFGHASTTDLRHWIRHQMPLAVGDRPWENEHVWAPFVTEWKGRFYMFYMASGRKSDGILTSASSDDLETWTKSDGPIQSARGATPSCESATTGSSTSISPPMSAASKSSPAAI